MAIRVNIDLLLAQRKMSDAICRTLDCQPGDVLEWVDD